MNTTTRRGILRAAPVAALAIAIPAGAASFVPAVDREAWERAMARYRDAKQASENYEAQVWQPASAREKAFEELHGVFHHPLEGEWSQAYADQTMSYFQRCSALVASHGDAHCIPEEVTAEHERLIAEMNDEEAEVLGVPAPDLHALRWKLERVVVVWTSHLDEDGSTPAWDASYVRQTILDIGRLLPGDGGLVQ